MLPVGLERVGRFGLRIGRELYYEQSLQMIFLVLAAFALSPAHSGRRGLPARITARPRRLAGSRGALAGILVLAAAAYAALYLESVRVTADASVRPRHAAAYVHRYLASARSVDRRTGEWPSILDEDVPGAVLSKRLYPYSTTGRLLALFDPRIRVEEIARPIYQVTSSGALRPLRFSLLARAQAEHATLVLPHAGGRTAAPGACVPRGASGAWLHLPMASVGSAAPGVDPLAGLRLRFRLPRAARVTIVPLLAGAPAHSKITREWPRSRRGALIALGAERELATLAIRLPPGGCVTGAAFGLLL